MVKKWLQAFAVACAAALTVTLVPTSASASAYGCKTEWVSGGNHKTQACLEINGGGLWVNYMIAQGYQEGSQHHVQLYGPPGHLGNGNTEGSGRWSRFDWGAYKNVLGGNYCAREWAHIGGGYQAQVTKCWTVW
ncbi:hypothetical protein [Streptomyces sp. NPDC000410]|uniref:hypothetical protein n=1 Tax=Streptomyces sp. NPDC000410 TaxID=3154254 RepID=UPI00332C757A